MAGFWDVVSTGWDMVTGGSSTWQDVSRVASEAYSGSFLESVIGASRTASNVATSISTLMYGEKGMPKAGVPQGQRVSSKGVSSVSPGSFKASAVDLGYTSKVQNAIRAAQNSKVGGSIQGTISRLQTKPSKGPLLSVGTSQIKVSPRARGN